MKKNDSKNEFISLLGRFFTEYLPVSVNASPNTIASYKCAFRLLFQYLNEETDIKIGHITFEALDFELLTKYFDWLITTRKNSRATAKQRLAALASLQIILKAEIWKLVIFLRTASRRFTRKHSVR
ncbi:MAG: phage integrase SAM-like domain-containing protein [Mediterraneibacter gnavus]